MTDTPAPIGASTPVEINPFFGGFVLETLTIGLYGEARSAIREYLQNGLDGVRGLWRRRSSRRRTPG